MEPRTLALRNGVDLPRVGLGTFRSSAAEVVSAVHAALGCGLRHIDTASIYKNQEAIGRALKTSNVPREQVHGATACAICRATPHGAPDKWLYSDLIPCIRAWQVFVTSKISPYEQGTEKAHAACLDILAKLDTGYVVRAFLRTFNNLEVRAVRGDHARAQQMAQEVLCVMHRELGGARAAPGAGQPPLGEVTSAPPCPTCQQHTTHHGAQG